MAARNGANDASEHDVPATSRRFRFLSAAPTESLISTQQVSPAKCIRPSRAPATDSGLVGNDGRYGARSQPSQQKWPCISCHAIDAIASTLALGPLCWSRCGRLVDPVRPRPQRTLSGPSRLPPFLVRPLYSCKAKSSVRSISMAGRSRKGRVGIPQHHRHLSDSLPRPTTPSVRDARAVDACYGTYSTEARIFSLCLP